jgi:CDP-glucose 4,6-dehydratase
MDYPLGQRLREMPGPLLLTGHTGFKGTWMTLFLEHLNVPVVGYSLHAEKDSLFDRAERAGAIPEEFSDIRNYEDLEGFIDLHKPSTIIHMAAQPLVLKSYESPRETFDVNVMGTVNVLDIAFKRDFVTAIIVVTTDKVYRNDNSGRAFVETDPLEGKDPYSASKVGTESVVAAWQQIAKVTGGPRVVSVRAGNVIGGGDFAENRLLPDLIRGYIASQVVEIRNPESTRPWQHVLDPLFGYLLALESTISGKKFDSMNFGPNETEQLKVKDVISIFNSSLESALNRNRKVNFKELPNVSQLEAEKLALDSSLANFDLKWINTWPPHIAVHRSGEWWASVLSGASTPSEEVTSDILEFLKARFYAS